MNAKSILKSAAKEQLHEKFRKRSDVSWHDFNFPPGLCLYHASRDDLGEDALHYQKECVKWALIFFWIWPVWWCINLLDDLVLSFSGTSENVLWPRFLYSLFNGSWVAVIALATHMLVHRAFVEVGLPSQRKRGYLALGIEFTAALIILLTGPAMGLNGVFAMMSSKYLAVNHIFWACAIIVEGSLMLSIIIKAVVFSFKLFSLGKNKKV